MSRRAFLHLSEDEAAILCFEFHSGRRFIVAMEPAKVKFFFECLAIRVGRYVDLGDVPFGDTVFIDCSRVGVREDRVLVRV